MMLIRPFIKKGESFQSYLYRCARLNSWTDKRLKQFLRAEVAPLYSYKADDREKLRDWLSNISDRGDVSALTDIWLFYSEFKEHFDFSRFKICPCCYKESGLVIPAYWHLRTYLVCVKHRVLLTDICTNCGEQLTAESVISGRCESCHCDLANFNTKNAKPDIYSKKAYDVFENCKTHEMFSEELQHLYIPLLKSINILAPLTGLATEIGYEYKQRRFLSIEQLYRYQVSCSELYTNSDKLSDCLVRVVNDRVSNRKISLANIFLKQSKDFEDDDTSFFLQAVRDLVLSEKLELEGITASLSWVAQLFEYDEKAFIQYVEKKHYSLINRKPRENTLVIHLPIIISGFQSLEAVYSSNSVT